jgi:hypothetical protein
VLFRPTPRGERSLLLVPVLPGSRLRTVEPGPSFHQPEPAPTARRSVLVAACVAGAPAALIAAAVLLFARGTGSAPKPTPPTVAPTHRAAAPERSVDGAAPVVHAPLQPPPTSGGERMPTTLKRLVAHLPVKLASTALLRVGSSVYAVGGSTRSGDTPSDGIWRLDLRSGSVTSVGRFVEPLTGAAAAARGGVLYLAGGWTGSQLATGILRWSPGQSSSLVTRLPVALRDGKAAFVGGRLYVAGGSPRQVYEVDVDAGTLTATSTAPTQLRARTSNLAYLTELSRAS